MPCRDYYDDHPDQYFKDITEPALKRQVSFAESALCQTLEAFDQVLFDVANRIPGELQSVSALDYINYAEAGIDREDLEVWWKNHKAVDKQMREAERIAKLRKGALAKLSNEERKALGVK